MKLFDTGFLGRFIVSPQKYATEMETTEAVKLSKWWYHQTPAIPSFRKSFMQSRASSLCASIPFL